MRVALVTGASAGIGAAVVKRLLDDGMHVLGIARRPERLAELAASCDAGDRLWVEACDVADEGKLRQCFAELESRWGAPDVLVNSAGVGAGAGLLDGDVAAWRHILDVNVIGLALASRLAVEAMQRQNKAGQIVHISSMSGHRTVAFAGMYAASKFAVQALTEGLRLELREQGSTIRVASIGPGTVATRFALEDDEPDRQRPYPLLQPDDVAAAVMHVVHAPPHVDIGDLTLRPTGQAR